MLMKVVLILTVSLPGLVFSLGKGSSCKTPNGERALCIPIKSCTILKDAIVTKNITIVHFARDSQCGYDKEPLVCCGSIAFKKSSSSTSDCTTPNGENAKCQRLSTCQHFVTAIRQKDVRAIQFAKQSQCGYKNEPLICCGSSIYPSKNTELPTPLIPDRTTCGFEKDDHRVLYGEITEIGEFPWMALLRYKYTDGRDAGFKCGGTVVNRRYVLTAAHCVILNTNFGFNLDMVRLGEWRISTVKDCEKDLVNQECSDPVVDLNIEKTIPYEQYNRRNGRNDIALLRLERDIEFTEWIRPICLPAFDDPDPEPNTSMYIAGWGTTENDTSSDVKLKAQIPIVGRTQCSAKIKQRGEITEDQICAGGVDGKDSCQGDSGGPLMGQYPDLINSRQQWFQEGIVSWGVGCGISGFPAIYTKVSKFVPWIIDTIKP